MEYFDRYQPVDTGAADSTHTSTTQQRPAPPSQLVTTGARDLPVALEPGDKLAGSSLDNVRSVLTILSTSRIFRLSAELQVRGSKELEALELRVDLLSKNNEMVASKLIKPVRRYGEPVRPGDRVPLSMMLRANAEVHQARVSVVMALLGPAVESYPDSPVFPLHWVAQQPAGVDITTRQRRKSIRTRGTSGSLYDVAVEVKNTGSLPIRLLRLDIRLLDARSEVVATSSRFVVSTTGPILLAQKTRVVRFLVSSDRPATQHVVVVADVR